MQKHKMVSHHLTILVLDSVSLSPLSTLTFISYWQEECADVSKEEPPVKSKKIEVAWENIAFVHSFLCSSIQLMVFIYFGLSGAIGRNKQRRE